MEGLNLDVDVSLAWKGSILDEGSNLHADATPTLASVALLF